jgi:hypothetical protein
MGSTGMHISRVEMVTVTSSRFELFMCQISNIVLLWQNEVKLAEMIDRGSCAVFGMGSRVAKTEAAVIICG